MNTTLFPFYITQLRDQLKEQQEIARLAFDIHSQSKRTKSPHKSRPKANLSSQNENENRSLQKEVHKINTHKSQQNISDENRMKSKRVFIEQKVKKVPPPYFDQVTLVTLTLTPPTLTLSPNTHLREHSHPKPTLTLLTLTHTLINPIHPKP